MNIIATTSRHGAGAMATQGREWAERLGVPFVPRGDLSLSRLVAGAGADGAVVVSADQLYGSAKITYEEPDSGFVYFFHPNLARMRIANMLAGHGDPMVTAMALTESASVLDCTAGRGVDAIVCAWVVGESGRVLGLEKVGVIAQLTIDGLANYPEQSSKVLAAMRRVRVLEADYESFLPQQPDGSFEVVYFDPIFDRPVNSPSAMSSLRHIADPRPLSAQALGQALRVARRRVVVRQRYGTPLWRDLVPAQILHAPKSRVEYGIFLP